jgi:sulfite exporter TauE/SafE
VGAGTLLPLGVLGVAGRLAGKRLKAVGARAGGTILVLLGLITILRGTDLHHYLPGYGSASHGIQSTDIIPHGKGKHDGARH